MKKCEAELKKAYNCKKIEIQNLRFFIFILIFSFSFFHLKEAEASFMISRPSTNNIGLVSHWTFDGKDVVNGVALDRAGSNNGNLVNIATSTFYSYGKIGQGFKFDGTNDYVTIADAPFDFERTNSFSASAWVKLASNAVENIILSKEGASPSYTGWAFYVEPGSLRVLLTNKYDAPSNGISKDSAIQIDDNVWHHVAFTYNGSSLASGVNIYIDGVLSNGTATRDNLSASILNNVSLNAGRGAWDGAYFNGNIDDARIYNRALLAAEVKMLYNMGR